MNQKYKKIILLIIITLGVLSWIYIITDTYKNKNIFHIPFKHYSGRYHRKPNLNYNNSNKIQNYNN